MRRVAVTGIGIVSSIGANPQEVNASLREGRSGHQLLAQITRSSASAGHVHGAPNVDIEAMVDKRVRRFMGDGAAWNYIAMEQAIADSGLGPKRGQQ